MCADLHWVLYSLIFCLCESGYLLKGQSFCCWRHLTSPFLPSLSFALDSFRRRQSCSQKNGSPRPGESNWAVLALWWILTKCVVSSDGLLVLSAPAFIFPKKVREQCHPVLDLWWILTRLSGGISTESFLNSKAVVVVVVMVRGSRWWKLPFCQRETQWQAVEASKGEMDFLTWNSSRSILRENLGKDIAWKPAEISRWGKDSIFWKLLLPFNRIASFCWWALYILIGLVFPVGGCWGW